MSLEITKEEAAELISAADMIYSVIGRAQGRADQCLARREELVVVQFPPNKHGQQEANCIFEFTEKEISKMPREFRKSFRYGGKNHRIRKKENGVYEIRFMYKGKTISASSKNLEQAKKKFIELCRSALSENAARPADRQTLKAFAEPWFENVKKPRIREQTIQDYAISLRVHIYPIFGNRLLCSIKPSEIDAFLGGYIAKNQMRTAEKLYGILAQVFKAAQFDGLIPLSPMSSVHKPSYEADEVVPLTREEEKFLLKAMFEAKHPCRYAIVFLLYTGMRRSELKDATSDGTWITTFSAKVRKGKNPKKRRIPISPMLRPYMDHFTQENLSFSVDRLSRVVPKFLPNHTTHHLRHTFITRAVEFEIPEHLIKLWVGHSKDRRNITGSVYTHFSEEFQLAQIEKINY